MDNVITAFFNCSRRAVTNAAWKGDRGMVLRFADVELPPVYEVHFSHSRAEAAKIVLGNDDGVEIPDEYFSGSRIYAWIYLTPETDVGYTVYEVEIPLQQRPATTDVEPTPEEESIIDQAISALNNAVEVSTEAAETAVEAAESVADAVDFVKEQEATLYGEILGGTVALTERVEGGTLLKNQLWVNKTCAVVGYAWDATNSRFRLYCVFATNEGSSVKTWLLYERDSENEPYELTMETAPSPFEVSASDMYKFVQNMSCVHHVDVRYCREVYDADNNLMYRIYSAQYRYAVDNGVASRTKVSTAPQNSSFIIDIGLKKSTASMRKTYNYKSDNEGAVLPLVSDNQNAQYQFIIPDSMFSGATYGLSVVTVMGNGWGYYGPTFDKAKPSIPELPAADGNYTLALSISDGTPTLTWVTQ